MGPTRGSLLSSCKSYHSLSPQWPAGRAHALTAQQSLGIGRCMAWRGASSYRNSAPGPAMAATASRSDFEGSIVASMASAGQPQSAELASALHDASSASHFLAF